MYLLKVQTHWRILQSELAKPNLSECKKTRLLSFDAEQIRPNIEIFRY